MNYQERLKEYVEKMADFCRDPAKYHEDPFRIYGPLYYVGDRRVCLHLIDAGEGLVLIDSGYPHCIHMLTDSIWRLALIRKTSALLCIRTDITITSARPTSSAVCTAVTLRSAAWTRNT